jgi:protein TonB
MAAATYRDDPWQRLPWLVPAAVALSLLSVTGFLALLAGPAYVARAPAAVEMQVLELPPSPAVVMPPLPEAEPPPPPPVVEPETLPLPEAKAAPPPPKPRPRPAKPSPSPPPPQATPSAPAPAAPPAAAPPDGGNMGARALYQPKPEIPEQLRHRSLELAALARFRIAADGSAQVELVEPTPDPDLNRSLMETLRKWRFFPELRNGMPVASTLDIRIPISVR